MQVTSFGKFVSGFTLMLTGIALAVIMPWVGSKTIDMFYNGTTLIPAAVRAQAAGPTYNTMMAANIPQMIYFVNLYYLLCMALGIIGIYLFITSIAFSESVDVDSSTPRMRPRF